MPVGDIYQVRFISQFGEQLAINVRHYRVSTLSAPEATATQIAVAVRATCQPFFAQLQSASASFLGVAAQKVRPLPAGTESGIQGPAVTGTVTGDPLPRQVSGLITLRTALAGRRNRGRMYTPFPAEFDNDINTKPTAGHVSLLNSLATQLLVTIVVPNGTGSSTIVPCLFHRRTGDSTDLTQASGRTVWATQRRRGHFGRPNIILPA